MLSSEDLSQLRAIAREEGAPEWLLRCEPTKAYGGDNIYAWYWVENGVFMKAFYIRTDVPGVVALDECEKYPWSDVDH